MKFQLPRQWPVILFSTLIGCTIILAGTAVFVRSRGALQEQIRERLRSTSAAAALHIDADAVEKIRTADDVEGKEYQQIIRELNELRHLPQIRFAYILRRTDDPNALEFVADADAALSDEELDVNQNGTVDSDEEPGYPGDRYDISDIPALQNEAFTNPSADEEVTYDQWGVLISGYAPIKRSDGTVVAVLGLDMRSEDFDRLSQSVFSPLALILLFLTALIAAVIVAYVWESGQVLVLKRINNERSGLLRLTFHQLGEPLTIMKWSLESLREETENIKLKTLVEEHITCMDEGLGRLNSIIDVLQFAEKIDLDTLDYVPAPTSLRSLLENATAEWQSGSRKGKQRIQVVLDKDIEINVDRTLITLALRQMLVNAVEYSEKEGKITVSAHRQHRTLHVSVQDKGCGIPPEDMEHLFEKYRRAKNAPLKKPDGNGLGLYIARGIIDKAGGKIWVESELGKGTTVHFTLPIA